MCSTENLSLPSECSAHFRARKKCLEIQTECTHGHHTNLPFLCLVLYTFLFPKIRLAEVEQASLMSEQLSDKSSSPALPDDLSLDDHSVYQLAVRDIKVYRHRHVQVYQEFDLAGKNTNK